jgi:hypothetical protein
MAVAGSALPLRHRPLRSAAGPLVEAKRRGVAVVVVGRDDAMSATAGDGGAASLTNRFIKIGRLTVNRVLDFHGNYRAISSAPIKHAVPGSTKASAATYGLDCT